MDRLRRNTIAITDALSWLATLPANSVHCVMTSPPYFNLRDYGGGGMAWPEVTFKPNPLYDFTVTIPEQRAALGSEATPQAYIGHLVAILREVRRVLRPDGVCWVNIGESSAGSSNSGGTGHKIQGSHYRIEGLSTKKGLHIKPKDLMQIPSQLSHALQADGWWLRSDVIWHKPNPMPSSAKDRCTNAYEHVFMLTKRGHYWSDMDAVRQPHKEESIKRAMRGRNVNKHTAGDGLPPGVHAHTMSQPKPHEGYENMHERVANGETSLSATGRNLRNVWKIATKSYEGQHFATMPPKLAERGILIGCPETCCAECGAGYVRIVERVASAKPTNTEGRLDLLATRKNANGKRNRPDDGKNAGFVGGDLDSEFKTIGWQPSCTCDTTDTLPGIVIDPFGGAGTTAIAALTLGRDYMLCEPVVSYVGLAQQRIQQHRLELANADPFQPIIFDETDAKQLTLFAQEA